MTDIWFLLIGGVIGGAGVFFWKKSHSSHSRDFIKLTLERDQIEQERKRLLDENQDYKSKEILQAQKSASLKTENEQAKARLEEQEQRHKETIEEKKADFERRIHEKEEVLQKKIDLLESLHRESEEKSKQLAKTAEDQFKNIANKIFQESTKSYREESSKNLSDVLKPFKENIENFKESIQKFTSKEKSMDENISDFRKINSQMRDEATKLSQALKGDSKTQGLLGEILLESLLEKSGLRKGEEFFPQAQLKDEKGNLLRPDVVVKLPDNKSIIIDAKVSFKHYNESLSSDKEEQKKEALKKFLNSVSSHIDNLSAKEYPQAEDIKAPDFTLMFIPNDGIFSLISQSREGLFDKAYKKSIIIVSPSTLFATLKTIASIWKIEKQNKNAEEIAKQGRLLYDKFVGFLEDMNKIDSGLKTARNSYDEAVSKLEKGRGNLLRKSEKLKNLEGKQKTLSQSDSLIQSVQQLKRLGVKNTKEIPANFKEE